MGLRAAPPSLSVLVDGAAANPFLCAVAFGGVYYLGATRDQGDPTGAILYTAVDGETPTPVSLPPVTGLVLFSVSDQDWHTTSVTAEPTAVVSLVVLDGVLYALAAWPGGVGRASDPSLAPWAVFAYDGATWTVPSQSPAELTSYVYLAALGATPTRLYAADGLSGLYRYDRYAWRWPDGVPIDAPTGSDMRGDAGGLSVAGAASAWRVTDAGVLQVPTLGDAVPGSLCWWQGEFWALQNRFPTGDVMVRQALYRCVAGVEWREVASWDVDTGGVYWYAGVHEGALLLAGALPSAARAGVGWSATVTPCVARYALPVLELALPVEAFIYRCADGLFLGTAVAPPLQLQGGGSMIGTKPVNPSSIDHYEIMRLLAVVVSRWGPPVGAPAWYAPTLRPSLLLGDRTGCFLASVVLTYADGTGGPAVLTALRLSYGRSVTRTAILDSVVLTYADGGGTPAVLASLAIGFGNGTGARAVLAGLTLGYRVPTHGEPVLASIAVGFADGTGDPAVLASLVLGFGDGSGDPAVLEVLTLTWGNYLHPRSVARLRGLALCYAAGPQEPTDPVLWIVVTFDRPLAAILVSTNLGVQDEETCSLLVRVESASPVDAWDTYTPGALGTHVYLPEPGATLRVGVIIPSGLPFYGVAVEGKAA